MRFSNDKMSEMGGSRNKIGDAKRSDRNKWAEEVEDFIRSEAPFPTSYDIGSIQPPKYGEFSYTEFAGGILLNTMSVEMNCRACNIASKTPSSSNNIIENWKNILKDKYELAEVPDKFKNSKKVFIVPGHNMFKIINWEVVGRLAHETDDVVFKLHPVTNEASEKDLAAMVGWNRIVPKTVSGFQMMLDAEEIWTSSASEFTATSILFDKKVHNYGSIFSETEGVYYPMTRELFLSNDPLQTLKNIIDNPISGYIFPFQSDWKERVRTYYKEALRIRKFFAPLAGNYVPRKPSGVNNPPKK